MQCVYEYQSPLGKMTMTGVDDCLTGLWFEGQKYFGSTMQRQCEKGLLPVLRQTICWLDCYFKGTEPMFTPALRLEGSPFQQCVWEILRTIPYGFTMTYGEIAREVTSCMGIDTMAAQAVGGAVGRNPISIIIPCHRVLGSKGSLTGYAGGVERKLYLLELEHIH